MKKWNELSSKGGKIKRLRRAMLPKEVYEMISPLIDGYNKSKSESVLDESRDYLINNLSSFTRSSQERIKYFLL